MDDVCSCKQCIYRGRIERRGGIGDSLTWTSYLVRYHVHSSSDVWKICLQRSYGKKVETQTRLFTVTRCT